MSRFLIIFSLFLFFISCNREVTASHVIINHNNGRVYQDSQPFSGVVWSDDQKSMTVECDNGVIKKIKLFYENGNLAAESESFVSEVVFYDCEGAPVDPKKIVDKYPKLMNTFVKCMEEFSMSVR